MTLFVAAGALFCAKPKLAQAEPKGLNVLQMRPVVDGVGQTEKATVLAPGRFHAGLFIDYANDVVEIGGDGNKRAGSVMDDLVAFHAAFGVGLFDGVSANFHLPYVHRSALDRAVDSDEISGALLGRMADASLGIKVNLLQNSSYALGLMPQVTLPTGQPEMLTGDGSATYGLLGLVSGRAGKVSWAYNGGYQQRQKAQELRDDRAASVVVRGQFLNFAGVEYLLSGAVTVGGHFQMKTSAGEGLDFTRSSPAEWQALAKYRPLLGLELFVGAGTGLGKGLGSPDYRLSSGLAWIPQAAPAARPRAALPPRPAASSARR